MNVTQDLCLSKQKTLDSRGHGSTVDFEMVVSSSREQPGSSPLATVSLSFQAGLAGDRTVNVIMTCTR